MKNNQKTVEERQLKILNLVRNKGDVKVKELAETFHISAMTARRDLEYLERNKLLIRTHGGAVSLDRASLMIPSDEKIALCRDCISEYASRFVENDDILFINGSLTALNLLHYIKDKRISVYTNNCKAIGVNYPQGVSIYFTGGEIRSSVMIGEYVMRNLLTLKADKTFIGCAAVYDDGEFRYDIPTEIGINEAMISRTDKEVYILADHTKIQKRESRENSYGSCTYDHPCTLITDESANPAAVEHLRRCGIRVILIPVSRFNHG